MRGGIVSAHSDDLDEPLRADAVQQAQRDEPVDRIRVDLEHHRLERLRQVRPASLFGKGQAEEIAERIVRDIEELLTRPVGCPCHKPIVWYKGFLYQAASWKTARRVVAKVEFHAGELFLRLGFIVTNLETPSRAVVRFYNKRGTAGQWIKEGK